jgi:hypothetical protein
MAKYVFFNEQELKEYVLQELLRFGSLMLSAGETAFRVRR